MRLFRSTLALAFPLALAISALAQLAPSEELLFNPGAEIGTLAGWTQDPGFGATTSSVDGGTYDPGYNPHSGSWQFVGDTYPAGGGAFGSLTQLVDVSAVPDYPATDIDGGLVAARVSFWENTYFQGGYPDYAHITLTFYDQDGLPIDTLSTPDQANTSGGGGDTWGLFTADYTLPVGTRGIGYTMAFFRGANGGTYIDAFIDDNSLTLVPTSAIPEPAVTALLFALAVLTATCFRPKKS